MFSRIVSICNRERPTTGIGKVGIESAKAVEAPLDPANPGGDKVKLLALGDEALSRGSPHRLPGAPRQPVAVVLGRLLDGRARVLALDLHHTYARGAAA